MRAAAAEVGPEHHGRRLDQFLVEVLPEVSRSQVQRLIRDGHVQFIHSRDRPLRPNTIVRTGDRVTVDLPEPRPARLEPQPLPLHIVYEDEDLVVVDKPAGMVVHPAAGHAQGTLVNALLHHISELSGVGGEMRPGIVHRLDRGTSGLMVVAKNDRSHQELARQFRDREIEKEYTTLVWGLVQSGRRIADPIGRDPRDRKKMSARARHARTAVTRVTRAENLGAVTLLRVAIATGRTHQIRVHLSTIGHPIVGDALYGGVRRHLTGRLRVLAHLDRPFLHASKLAFRHPADLRRIEFDAPLPEDLQRVLEELILVDS